ncbi:DNA internalization-related competence protein ComEC/Rec2 [Peribacillus huizhouensis]|uniref:Competence protein ComEC n=1 Tax=Peribacillus huizhouensis TaxID=1501239 RepID=A0ABR6CKI8_9BACI|nr:DNA internalization-related competence protein ComEC/Rec2 [Peribacillus huizhouensis]MBA9025502.1 competence protein ComEC [Peribacillus huizhouensis]
MTKQLIFACVSATFGVTVFPYFGWEWLICALLYYGFLFFKIPSKILVLHLVVLLLFGFSTTISEKNNRTELSGKETNFTIIFTDSIDIDGDLLKGFVRTDNNEKLQLKYKISSESEKINLQNHLKIAMSCPAMGVLEIPSGKRNFNSFDYRLYLKRQGIHWVLKADSIQFAKCMSNKHSIKQAIQDFRNKGISYVNIHFPESSRGYVNALIFGDQKLIDEEELKDYQRLGIVHLLAISGLHVSFLTGMIFFIGIRAGVTREQMSLVMLLFLPIYIILSGASPSVLRSCFMAMLFFFLAFLKKSISATETISIIYLLLLLFNPNHLYNIGFQLSFSVAFAIIMSLSIMGRFSNQFIALLVTSILCQLAAIPILLFHFFEFSLIGVLLNVIFIPIYSVILLPFAILVLLIHLLTHQIGDLLLFFLNKSFVLCNAVAGFTADLPFAYISIGKPTFPIHLLLVVVIFLLLASWDLGDHRKTKILSLVLILLLVLQYNIQKLSPFGEVTFIDIGQGDSIFIKLPFNKGNFLIDTGGSLSFEQEVWKVRRKTYSTGEDIVIPFLKSKGFHTLDLLILTHPDADHIGSADDIVKHIDVKKIIIGGGSEEIYKDQGFIQTAIKLGIEISSVKRGDHWSVGDARFYVLNPYQYEEDTNESSIVLYAEIGGGSWLFTGDLGEQGEQELIQVYPDLSADILKVGHHGSKTSSSEAFIDSLQPKIAIISAGVNNRYGHPHQQVLEILSKAGVSVYRTDLKGAISYQYDKKGNGTFSTSLP